MHIAEGVLSPAVLAGGAVLALAGTALGCANWSMIVWWLWGSCQRLFL